MRSISDDLARTHRHADICGGGQSVIPGLYGKGILVHGPGDGRGVRDLDVYEGVKGERTWQDRN